MATRKQIAAGRRNALKSTAPRSERRKALVRLNALRHGLRAKPGTLSEASLNELTRIQAARPTPRPRRVLQAAGPLPALQSR